MNFTFIYYFDPTPVVFEHRGVDVSYLIACLVYADYLYIFTRINLYSQNLYFKG